MNWENFYNMKNKELIEILSNEDDEAEVFLLAGSIDVANGEPITEVIIQVIEQQVNLICGV